MRGQMPKFFINFAADYEKEIALHFLAHAVIGSDGELQRV